MEQLIDYNVVDQNGDEIGTLHSLWSDPDTGAVEFLGVKTGWLFGYNHVVPAGKAELDEATNVVRLPYTEAFIKEAPTMSADSEISEEEETNIYQYYGMSRGEAAGTGTGSVTGSSEAGSSIGAATSSVPEAAGAAALADASGVGDGASQFAAPVSGSGAGTSSAESTGSASRWRRTSKPGDPDASAGTAAPATGATEAVGAIGAFTGTSSAGESVRAALDDLSPSDSSGTRTRTTAAAPGSYGTANLYGSTGTSTPVSADVMGTASETGLDTDDGDTTRAGSATRETGDANLDPITGEPGAHPVGTGVGALGGGTAGAAIGGAIGGPIGAPVGAVIGGIIGAVGGGLAGKGVAESINPTEENTYWESNYRNASYFQNEYEYADYAPGYKTGYEGFDRYGQSGRDFTDAEPDLQRDYEQSKGSSRLEWDKAKAATRDAWERLKAKASSTTK